ncbi:MAG: hypothetical protein EBX80_07785 [Acidimicrobiia bacterium]|nr:hypothetical protein [Acidimicrobiia bacterium]
MHGEVLTATIRPADFARTGFAWSRPFGLLTFRSCPLAVFAPDAQLVQREIPNVVTTTDNVDT